MTTNNHESGSDPQHPTADLPAAPVKPDEAVTPAVPLREGPGSRIGPYKILKQIGEGGFGVVFLAEQEKPVIRRVALKIIKLGMDTRQVVARFEQERQALAIMDHPGIAKVFDAGSTESGRPYFVMEFCSGEPIDQYCDRNRLSITDRLELFVQVCEAVQHAHTKAIIHRDIKPSNILVFQQDNRLTVKVIDFGIAKATASKLTEKTLFTEHRQLIGTPEYMSPEQAEGSLDIDTRTDVYSLGVLLYQLLTGSTPFSGRELRSAGLAEIQRIIREVDPPKPSTRLSTNAAALAGVASKRHIEPKKISALVRGELDWIVMTAMEKDRARRYETASGLALDIRRYLEGDSVSAVPPSRVYRLQKFVRRNKGPVVASAAVGVALLAGVIAFAWQAAIAREQRDLAVAAQVAADEQRDRAVSAEAETQQRADELEQVSAFQARMLGQVDPTAAGVLLTRNVAEKFEQSLVNAGLPEAERAELVETFNRQWSRVNATDAARDLIDRTILQPSIQAIDEEFADQPTVNARLKQVLADLYYDFSMYDAALVLQESALEIRRRVLGDEHRDTVESIGTIAIVLMGLGRLDEAEAYFRESVEKHRRVMGEDHPDTVTTIGTLGTLLWSRAKFDEAETYIREALEKHRRILGDEHRETLVSINNVGYVLQARGKFSEAEPYFREVLETARRVVGEEHPTTLFALNNMGFLFQTQGKLSEAEPYYREALEKRRRVLGEEHNDTLTSLNNMGVLLQGQGKPSEAEPYFREVLEKRRRVLGEHHPDTLWAMNNMGGLFWSQGKYAEAEPYWREALEGRRIVLGEFHPDTLISTIHMGVLHGNLGRFSEAVALLTSIEDLVRNVFIDADPHRVTSLVLHLGKALVGLGTDAATFAEAERRLLEAHERLNASFGRTHQETIGCIRSLIELYTKWHALDPEAGHDAKITKWQTTLPPDS